VSVFIYVMRPFTRLEQWCPVCIKPALIEVHYRMLTSQGVSDGVRRQCGACSTKWEAWPWPVTYEAPSS
jgi:hypothetical protein